MTLILERDDPLSLTSRAVEEQMPVPVEQGEDDAGQYFTWESDDRHLKLCIDHQGRILVECVGPHPKRKSASQTHRGLYQGSPKSLGQLFSSWIERGVTPSGVRWR
ncbi:MAG: hypothetical protein ACE366_16430 [Bradymonadia bacterium]